MSIRGKTAIVGIGEVPTRRYYDGRTTVGLAAEAIELALRDARLTKSDIDGLITGDEPGFIAEYVGLLPRYATGVHMFGASGATSIAMATAAINAGYCHTAVCVMSQGRQRNEPFGGAGHPTMNSEYEAPYGPAVAANNGYALLYQRHMYEFGTKPEQMAKLAANQRFNALKNPNSAFQGQPITVEDVLSSRYINEPLHLLECVMPCAGAAAAIVTSAERARAMLGRPAYVLGAGIKQGEYNVWQKPRITTAPALVSAAKALTMAGYRAADMQFAEFYD